MTLSNHPSHDLLLLLLNLAQQKSAERVRATFIDAAASIFAPLRIRWLDPGEVFDGEVAPVATLHREYGRIAAIPSERSSAVDALPLLQNAAGMLAVILEKLEADRLLASEKLLLEELVDARTTELSKVNAELERQSIELDESRNFLASVADTTPDLLYVYDLEEKRNIYINRELINLFGYTPQQIHEMGGRVMEIIMHPDDLEAVFRHHEVLRTVGDEVLELDYRMKEADGSWRWLRSRDKAYLRNEDGTVKQIIGVASDITARKAAETARRESELNLQKAQRLTHIGSWCWDLGTDMVECSEEMLRMWGLAPGQKTLALSDALERIHEEDRQRVEEAIRGALSKGYEYDLEFRLVIPDRGVRIVHGLGEVVFDDDGTPVTMRGTSQDITERKQAEQALRASEQLLRTIAENYPRSYLSIIERDLTVGYSTGQEFKRQGLDPDQFVGMTVEQVFGDHAPFVLQRYEKTFAGEEQVFELIIGDQHQLYKTVPLVAGDGSIPQILTVVENVTEQKEAEQALRVSEAKFRTYVTSAPLGIFIADAEARYLEVNAAACGMTGYTEAELLGMSIPDLLPPGVPVVNFQKLKEAGRTSHETVLVRKDGSPFDARIDATALPDGRFMAFVSDITERKQAEQALRESESRLELAIHGANLGMWDWDIPTGHVTLSDRWYQMLGYEPGELAHDFTTWDSLLHPEDKPGVLEILEQHFEDDSVEYDVVFRFKARAGDWRWINARGRVVEWDGDGSPLRMVGTHLDITRRMEAEKARTQLEDQLHQSQKMEAVGRLAGGVAHDFNNILTGILGFAELAQSALGAGDPVHADLEEIRKAAGRAADLTAQLLAFSRKQIINPRVIQPNDVLQNSQRMLERIIGEDVELRFRPTRDLWRIKADTGQLDQILVNLAVNARDAMPDGGMLTIETQNAVIDGAYCRLYEGAVPGDYAMLAVSDSGHGMDAETLEHIFEPFYSTKDKDRGTGLGLSTVYGIMMQNKGFINVSSAPDQGTVFKIYFPAVIDEPEEEFPVQLVAQATGSETILLVEDEEMVRRLATKILEKHGYNVIEKENGGMAFMWAEQNDDRVDLLLTDVIMPGMNGRDLLGRLQQKRPGLKALFMSGYTEDVIANHGVLEKDTEFIQKPFNVATLTARVREALDR